MSKHPFLLAAADDLVYFESTEVSSNCGDGLDRLRDSGTGAANDHIRDLGQVLDKVAPVVRILRNSLTDLNNPSNITVEFGIKLGGNAGLVFSSINAEANFKITVNWTKK